MSWFYSIFSFPSTRARIKIGIENCFLKWKKHLMGLEFNGNLRMKKMNKIDGNWCRQMTKYLSGWIRWREMISQDKLNCHPPQWEPLEMDLIDFPLQSTLRLCWHKIGQTLINISRQELSLNENNYLYLKMYF